MITRLLLIGAYSVMALLGVLSAFTPPPTYQQNTSQVGTVIWSAFLIAGGILCAVEVVHRHWAVKAVGLTLLASAVLSYATVLLLRANSPTLPYAGWLLLAFSLFLLGRLGEIIRILRENRGSKA